MTKRLSTWSKLSSNPVVDEKSKRMRLAIEKLPANLPTLTIASVAKALHTICVHEYDAIVGVTSLRSWILTFSYIALAINLVWCCSWGFPRIGHDQVGSARAIFRERGRSRVSRCLCIRNFDRLRFLDRLRSCRYRNNTCKKQAYIYIYMRVKYIY